MNWRWSFFYELFKSLGSFTEGLLWIKRARVTLKNNPPKHHWIAADAIPDSFSLPQLLAIK